ncbi:transposase [Oscillospiraceae bacterium 38-13]
MEEYLSGQGSSMAIAEKYKLRSGNLVLDWVKEYHRHRNSVEEAGGVSMTKRKHTLEERVQAVREHLEDGKSYSELSERYGSTTQVIGNG